MPLKYGSTCVLEKLTTLEEACAVLKEEVDHYNNHQVQIHMVPNSKKQTMHIRIWCEDRMVQSVTLPLERFRVHF